MKPRNVALLGQMLDEDLAWRKRELGDIRLLVKSDPVRRGTYLRAGTTLLYAHWEGFVKRAASLYLDYVHSLGVPVSQASLPLRALACRATVESFRDARRSRVCCEVLETLLDDSGRIAFRPGLISTDSNLSSAVFADIAGWLGIETLHYETKYNLIDESLLARRNRVAHGEGEELKPHEFADLVDEVFALLGAFHTDVLNQALSGAHVKLRTS